MSAVLLTRHFAGMIDVASLYKVLPEEKRHYCILNFDANDLENGSVIVDKEQFMAFWTKCIIYMRVTQESVKEMAQGLMAQMGDLT